MMNARAEIINIATYKDIFVSLNDHDLQNLVIDNIEPNKDIANRIKALIEMQKIQYQDPSHIILPHAYSQLASNSYEKLCCVPAMNTENDPNKLYTVAITRTGSDIGTITTNKLIEYKVKLNKSYQTNTILHFKKTRLNKGGLGTLTEDGLYITNDYPSNQCTMILCKIAFQFISVPLMSLPYACVADNCPNCFESHCLGFNNVYLSDDDFMFLDPERQIMM